MKLDNSLVKSFAALNKTEEVKTPSTHYGTARVIDENTYVVIDGSSVMTPCVRTVDAIDGDRVIVTIKNHSAVITGNISTPVDASKEEAEEARQLASEAAEAAGRANDAASAAQRDADTANTAATNAQASANQAVTAASNAQASADLAATTATNAQNSATRANTYANDALTQLSTVENVVGTLTWLAEHGEYSLTSDTRNLAGKTYFTRSGAGTEVDPYVYTVYTSSTDYDPHALGLYELGDPSETVSNYISTHLALAEDGLYVLMDNSGYKLRISNDSIEVIDSSGHVVTTFGENIIFDSSRPQYIGGQDAYIMFYDSDDDDVPDSIQIGGSNVTVGGSNTLSEAIANANNTLIYDHTYEYVRDANYQIVSADFTAFVYRGGSDVKSEYDASCFTWYLKKEDTDGITKETYLGSGYTISVLLTDCGYGAEIIGKFTPPQNATALTSNDDTLTTSDDEPLTVRASGESVRVSDLSVSTTLYSTDKLMVVGGEDEHLVSIQTLQDYLNANLTKQVLFGTTAEWNAQTSLVSEANKIYVYTDHRTYQERNLAGIKVGDGDAYLIDMPFIDEVYFDHIQDTSIHVTPEDKLRWNEAVKCYHSSGDMLTFIRV